MIIHSIYKFTNKVTRKSYIGYTKNVTERFNRHKNSYKKANTVFYRAIRKYGWDSFTFEVIYQSLDGEHCHNIMENYFIKEYRSFVNDNGYNQTYGGDGIRVTTEETRWKMGTANRGKKRGSPSEETRRKIGEANRQKRRTEEQKEHIRNIRIGCKAKESTIIKKSKRYIITNPQGEIINVINLNRFCKENKLNQGAMSGCALGRLLQHKGWKVRFDTPT